MYVDYTYTINRKNYLLLLILTLIIYYEVIVIMNILYVNISADYEGKTGILISEYNYKITVNAYWVYGLYLSSAVPYQSSQK